MDYLRLRFKTSLLFVIFFVCVSAAVYPFADTHTEQYCYTYIKPGINFPEFTAVGLFDEEEFVYYDSNIRSLIPKTKWMVKIRTSDSEYWNRQTRDMKNQHDLLQDVTSVMQNVNHTTGDLVLQLMCGCEDNNTPFMQFGFDGEDYFSLDIKKVTWASVIPQTERFITEWDPKGDLAKHWKDYLKTNCMNWLHKTVSYSNESLERKVRPEASVFQNHSSSPKVVCHATGFFPRSVNITWQKDGEDVHEDVELRDTLPNEDGNFQKRSILTVPPEELQKHTYTCVIQHSSLEKEGLVLPVSERRILRGGGSDGGPSVIIIAVVVCLMVLVAVVVGIVVWKKRNSDFSPVPPRAASEGDSSSNKNGVTVCVPAEERTSHQLQLQSEVSSGVL